MGESFQDYSRIQDFETLESQTQNTELKEDYIMVIIPSRIYSQFIC